MTNPFSENYASYYDYIYQDKDYEAEVDYLEEIWSIHSEVEPDSIVDLGCGTGGHGLILAERGHSLVGVDQSDEMIKRARKKISEQGLGSAFKVRQSGLGAIDFDRVFDGAISMFSVIGYLTNLQSLTKALRRVRDHIQPGGLFIFDTWYGPAIFDQRLKPEFKRFSVDPGTLYRFTNPNHQPREQIVTVNFELILATSDEGVTANHEAHDVRYFFEPEMRLLADRADLSLVDVHPFLELGEEPHSGSRDVTWVLRRPLD